MPEAKSVVSSKAVVSHGGGDMLDRSAPASAFTPSDTPQQDHRDEDGMPLCRKNAANVGTGCIYFRGCPGGVAKTLASGQRSYTGERKDEGERIHQPMHNHHQQNAAPGEQID